MQERPGSSLNILHRSKTSLSPAYNHVVGTLHTTQPGTHSFGNYRSLLKFSVHDSRLTCLSCFAPPSTERVLPAHIVAIQWYTLSTQWGFHALASRTRRIEIPRGRIPGQQMVIQAKEARHVRSRNSLRRGRQLHTQSLPRTCLEMSRVTKAHRIRKTAH